MHEASTDVGAKENSLTLPIKLETAKRVALSVAFVTTRY